MESNVIVWHSTEGTSLPSYGGGSSAPNFTAVPDFKSKRLVWYQHFDFDTSARALVNRAGGVETNSLNVVQVEIVGTCDPATHKKWGTIPHLYTPELPDWAILELAHFARWARDEHGVPLTSGVTWKAYPSSYGSNGVRMSATKWSGFKGHCGHQHVPENDHGDPGTLPIARILSIAAGTTEPTEEDPLAGMTPDQIYDAVWRRDRFPAPDTATTRATNKTWQAESVMADVVNKVRALDARIAAQNASITELSKAVAALAANRTDVDVDALVARIREAIDSIEIRLDTTPEA
jgi:uncharacterized coiled-coil protein SlyX